VRPEDLNPLREIKPESKFTTAPTRAVHNCSMRGGWSGDHCEPVASKPIANKMMPSNSDGTSPEFSLAKQGSPCSIAPRSKESSTSG
jgi:hypothetical protein